MTDTNTAPTITIDPSSKVYDAKYTGFNVYAFNGVTIDDVDDDQLTVTISFEPSAGDLYISSTAIPYQVNTDNGVKTYSFTGAKAALTDFLAFYVQFNPDENKDGSGPIDTIFTIGVKDSANPMVTDTVTVTTTDENPSNAAPRLAVDPGTETTTTTHTSANVTPFTGLTIADADDDQLTLTITFDGVGGSLVFPDGMNVEPTDPNSGEPASYVTYTVQGSKDALTALMHNVQFDPNNYMQGQGTLETTFEIRVSDAYHKTPLENTSIKVIAENAPPPPQTAPTITIDPSEQTWDTTYTGSSPLSVFRGVAVDDVNDDDLTVTISYDPFAGHLLLKQSANVQVQFSVENGTETYTLFGKTADLTEFLQSNVQFDPDDSRDGSGPIKTDFTIGVKDATHDAVVSMVTVNTDDETPGNTAPTVAVNSGTETTFTTHIGPNVSPFTGLSIADANDDQLTLTITFNYGDGELIFPSWANVSERDWNSEGGFHFWRSYTVTGTAAYLTDLMQHQVQFDPNDDLAGEGAVTTTFEVDISDDSHRNPTKNYLVKVVADDPGLPNNPPTIAVDAGQETTAATDTGGNVTPFTGVTIDDADDDQLTVTISFDPAGGDLVFLQSDGAISSTDQQTGIKTYTLTGHKDDLTGLLHHVEFDPSQQNASSGAVTTGFTIVVQDGSPDVATDKSISVVTAITDKNHAPDNLQLAGSPIGTSVPEGSAVIGALTATDQDNDTVT